MKVLVLSTYPEGGAGGAAGRLQQGLKQAGVSAEMLLQRMNQGKGDNDDVHVLAQSKLTGSFMKRRPALDKFPLRSYPKRKELFYVNWLPDTLLSTVEQMHPDVINLHWIQDAFVRIETLPKFKKPIVWTLHDMWAFTGGCIHSHGCNRYMASCGSCPILASDKENDLSRRVWQRKAKAWKDLDLTVTTPSKWLAESARASSLFKDRPIEVIPNGINIHRYRPVDKRAARDLLGLPHDKQIVLFGAWTNHHNKGFHLLLEALQHMSAAGWGEKVELVVFGFSEPKNMKDSGIKTRFLGRLYDDISLALLYGAADILVAPSYQENLPTIIIEALACGTPAVAFNIGGVPDIIDHQQNGYIAQPYETQDLARGITWVLEDHERHAKMRCHAREKAEREYSMELQARRFLDLFEKAVERYYNEANQVSNGGSVSVRKG